MYTITFSQMTQNIRGTVIDADSKQPLFGANIVVTSLNPIVGAVSDFDGNFILENIPIGRHTIQITYLGYETQTIPNLELQSAKELVLNISLQESVMKTGEVVIKAKKRKRKGDAINNIATVSAQEFTIEQTGRYAGSLNDVARMATNFAGVQGTDDSRNDIVVRGNSPLGVLYRLNGVDIPNPNHFASMGTSGGPVSILNTNAMENSDFMTSAFPAEYGNATSGVFDIHLRKGNNHKFEFLAQVGFNGFEAMIEGPLSKKKKSSFLVGYRYSTLGLMKKLGVSFGTGTAVPIYQDAVVNLNFPYENGSFSIWGTGGLSKIAFLGSEIKNDDSNYSGKDEDLRFGSQIGVVGFSNTHRFNKKEYVETSFSVDYLGNKTSLDKQYAIDSVYLPFYRNNSYEGKYSIKTKYNNKINSQHLLQVGIELQRKFFNLSDSVRYEGVSKYVIITESKGAAYFSQFYAQWQYKISTKVKLNVGVHSQYFFLNKDYSIEPRLGLKWKINSKHSLSFGYGMHSQLNPIRIYFEEKTSNNGKIYYKNRDLKMYRSQHFVLGYNWDFMKNTRFKAEAYFQYLDNIPVEKRESTYSIINGGDNFRSFFYPDSLTNNGTAYNYGLELTIEKFLHKGWYILSTASLYESKYKASDNIERNTAFNGNYTFNLLGGKEFFLFPKKENKKMDISLLFDGKITLNGGKRYIPIDIDKSKLAHQAVYDFDKAYEPRHPLYFRADINAGFKINMKGITQEFTFTLRNVSDTKNIFSQQFNANKGELYYKYQNGLFPMVTYKVKF